MKCVKQGQISALLLPVVKSLSPLSRMAAHLSVATYHYQNITVFCLDNPSLKQVKQNPKRQEKGN